MSDRILLEVVGVPAPQGSKTPIHRAGKTWMIEGGSATGRERHTSWRQGVETAARDWLRDHQRSPLDEPLSVEIEFRFPLPKSDRYRTLHASKPDLSKLVRSTEDALVTGGLMRDDALICSLHVRKRYAQEQTPPGATIEIWPMGEVERLSRESRKSEARTERKATNAC